MGVEREATFTPTCSSLQLSLLSKTIYDILATLDYLVGDDGNDDDADDDDDDDDNEG